MKINQKGFSAVEGLLILVVIGIIGGAGWYVFKSRSQATKSLDSANNTTSYIAKQKSQPKTTPTKQYLEVKEWGVKIPLTSDISDLTYQASKNSANLHDKTQVIVKFYTARAKKAAVICDSNNFTLTVSRGVGSDIPVTGDGPGPEDDSANSYASLAKNKDYQPEDSTKKLGVIKLGDYYYNDNLYPGAACENYNDPTVKKATEEEQARVPAIISALKSMEKL
jgi:uncharacterized protein (UPF0333 family)